MTTLTEVSGKLKHNQKVIGVNQWLRITLLTVLGYEAAGCLLGGGLLVAAPDGRYMDMPVDMMNGFFPDFFIPGIILFALGLLNTYAFFSVLRKSPYDWFMAMVALVGLAIWFVVEIIILQELHWLHFMWGIPVYVGLVVAIPLVVSRSEQVTMQKILLTCGILSTLWYVVINIFVPLQDNNYSIVNQTVSELSAIGAPTRVMWVLLAMPYPLLFVAFGWGVFYHDSQNHALRVVGRLIVAYCIFTFYWPPMQMRGNEMALTDILHLIWGGITLLMMLVFMVYGAKAFGKQFRLFTLISIMLFIVFGILTGVEGPHIATNEPTPMIGVWERINIAIFMLWVVVFAIALLRDASVSNSR